MNFRGGAAYIAVMRSSDVISSFYSTSLSDHMNVIGNVIAELKAKSNDGTKVLIGISIDGYIVEKATDNTSFGFISIGKLITGLNSTNHGWGTITGLSTDSNFPPMPTLGRIRYYPALFALPEIVGYGPHFVFSGNKEDIIIGRFYTTGGSEGGWGDSKLPVGAFGGDFELWVNVAR